VIRRTLRAVIAAWLLRRALGYALIAWAVRIDWPDLRAAWARIQAAWTRGQADWSRIRDGWSRIHTVTGSAGATCSCLVPHQIPSTQALTSCVVAAVAVSVAFFTDLL
jgi:hypothetical protein